MLEFLKSFFIYSENKPLLFSQFVFWLYFIAVYLVFTFIYKKHFWRNTWLFIVSVFFYYKSGGYFVLLLLFTTGLDYCFGLLLSKNKQHWKRKLFVTLSVIMNLGVLAYFKYTYFIIEIINETFHRNLQVTNYLSLWSNSLAHTNFDISTIILPVGISFYTFQSLSYTIDVYRNKIEPIKNFIDFGFFVSFFPQLVAGPIVRAADFIPQFYAKYQLSKQEFGISVFLILNGLLKKIVISDYISINYIDRIFDAPARYSGFENLMAVYGYAIQIYCDFSGYTDIAIGVVLLLGFRLPVNFNSPYKAVNITDFWRRWHISLSTWLRDYLYISLGGNRKGKIRTYINLLLTMILGGLWHGASLRFVIWGTLHGFGLVFHKLWTKIPFFNKSNSQIIRFLSLFLTFHFVCLTWIFFRAETMENVEIMIKQIVFNFDLFLIPTMIISYKTVFSLMLAAFVIHWLPRSFKDWYKNYFVAVPFYAKIFIILAVCLLLFQINNSEIQPFIYFQF